MECKHCGGSKFFVKMSENDTHKGLYCASCGKWHKWVGKKSNDIAELKKQGKIVDEPIEGKSNLGVLNNDKKDLPFDFGTNDEQVMKKDYCDHVNSNVEAPYCRFCMEGQELPEFYGTFSQNKLVIKDHYLEEISRINGNVIGKFKIRVCPVCGRLLDKGDDQ